MSEIKSRECWLRYRKTGIGASDAYVIMKQALKWRTPLDLYEEKISNDVSEKSSFIMDKGNNAEPKIRALVEFKHGVKYKPLLVKSNELSYIMASLDGYNEETKTLLEIKLVGKKIWDSGKVPEKYITQVQHQYMSSGAKNAYVAMYLESEFKMNGPVTLKFLKIIEIKPDYKYQAKLLKEEIKFWENHVLKRKPPKETDYDYKSVKSKNIAKVRRYLSLKKEIEEKTKEAESLREVILEAVKSKNHNRLVLDGLIKAQKITSKGRVQYKLIPELKDVDLDKYRSKDSVSWKLTEVKGEK